MKILIIRLKKKAKSHKLVTIGGFWVEGGKRQNRKALIINELKGVPGRIENDDLCLMRTMGGVLNF
jgi:hypothetical protein